MGSKADFYVGRDTDAEWLGSIAWDGMPAGIPRALLVVTDEEAWRTGVGNLLDARGDTFLPKNGWPWTWDSSHGTKYTYSFDAGRVWACCYGSSWWKADAPEPDHTTLKRKAARLPDMAMAPKLASGDIFTPPPKKKRTRP